jgi:hypothetical protein
VVLRVAWQDPTGCARGLEPIALAELARLLGRMGLAVRWRVDSGSARPVSDEVRVVVLDRAAMISGCPRLGASPVSRLAGPVAWVHLPSVQATLGMRPGALTWRRDPRARWVLGIAVGRVAAHETVHAVAPGVPHGRGLMSEKLHQGLLTGPAPPIAREVTLGVRAALAGRLDPERDLATLERRTVATAAAGPD